LILGLATCQTALALVPKEPKEWKYACDRNYNRRKCAECNVEYPENEDNQGDTIKRIRYSTWDRCGLKCYQHKDCVVWSFIFNKKHWKTNRVEKNVCVLKRSEGNGTQNIGWYRVVSGKKGCPGPPPTCEPRNKKKECYKIKTRDECLTTKDNRQSYRDQDCVWCLHECPNGNFCEPRNVLEKENKNKDIHFETCLISEKKWCQQRDKKKECYKIRDREECLTSQDNRSKYENQDCVWCVKGYHTGNKCPNGDECVPRGYLDRLGFRKEKDYETCF